MNGDVLNGQVGWPYGRVKLVSENIQVADGDMRSQWVATFGDTLAVSDSGKYLTHTLSADAAFAVIDQAVYGRRLIRYVDEGVTIFDEFIKSVILGGTGGLIVTKVVDNYIEVTDGIVSWVYRRKELSEALTILDNTATARSYIKQLTENLTVVDSVVPYVFRKRLAEDTITVIDGVLAALLRVRGLVDSVTVTDSLTTWARRTAVVTDPITVTDELRFWRRLVRLVDENVTIIEGFIKSLVTGGGIINTRIVDEAFSVGDSTNRYWTHVAVASEALVLSEQTIKYLTRIRYVNESVDVQDGYVTMRIRRSVLSELLDIPDSLVSLFLPSVTYTVRIRIGQEPTFIALGVDESNCLGAEYPIVLNIDEPNLLSSRADNLLGATA
jgi:hypothetical protein